MATSCRVSSPTQSSGPAVAQLRGLLLTALACLPLVATAQLSVPAEPLPPVEESPADSVSGVPPSSFSGGAVRLPNVGGDGRPPSSVTPDGGSAAAQRPTPSGPEPIDRIIAVVNQGVITEHELDSQVRLIEGRQQSTGGALPPREELRRQMLEQMILQLAQEQFAAEYGMKPTESEIDRAAADVAQNNGLSTEQLRQRLAADGIAYDSFRRQLSAEIVSMRLRERETANSVTISEAEVDGELAKSGQISEPEFEVQQILLKLPEGADKVTVDRQRAKADALVAQARKGADFSELAAQNSDAPDSVTGGDLGWRTASRMPGLFADAVKALKPGEVSPALRSPAGFHILKLKDKRDGGTVSVERTHARHILLPVTSPEEEADAVRRLEEFKRNIEGGQADFAVLARDFSKDNGSARKGGDLGWLYPGETVPDFERAMQVLSDGQISDPVRSQFGLHLIQVLGRRTDTESPERLRNEARRKLRTTKGGEAYDQWLRELRDRTYVEYRLEES
ncbi:MAG: peptidylprolyl isomerase [Lautropia sp.]|nr:peptidylprolyl isomerase [Lautropia sp.]